MKREINITQPEYLFEDWPGKYDIFSWFEYIVTTRKADSALNDDLQSWGFTPDLENKVQLILHKRRKENPRSI